MPAGKWTFDNPVIAKELRGRMRGPRAYWMLLGYLLLLSIAMLLSYYGWWERNAQMQNGSITGSFTAGREFYMVLFIVQACLVALIAPALTSGAISIEREQRTLEMLQCTTLRPRALVAGKLVASLSYIILLLTASIPLISICFLLGGVSPQEVGGAYLMLICDAFLFGAVALCWSVYAVNTVTSVILSYLMLAVYFGVTLPFAFAGFGGMGQATLSTLNPVGALSAALSERWYGAHLPSWVLGAGINSALALLACWLAVHRLEDEGRRRTLLLRLYLFAFLFALLVTIDGSGVGIVGISGSGAGMGVIGVVGLTGLLLFLPTLTTGEIRDFDPPQNGNNRWLTFDPRDAFRMASLRTVFPTAIVTGVVATGATLAAWAIWLKFVPGAFRTPNTLAIVIPATALLLATCVFIASMGLFLSVLLRNRWGALCLVYIAIFMVMATPFIVYSNVEREDALRVSHDLGTYLLYLSPIFPVMDAYHKFSPTYYSDLAVAHYLPGYGTGFVWVITSALYLLLTVVLTAAARWIHSRRDAAERLTAAKHNEKIAAA